MKNQLEFSEGLAIGRLYEGASKKILSVDKDFVYEHFSFESGLRFWEYMKMNHI